MSWTYWHNKERKYLLYTPWLRICMAIRIIFSPNLSVELMTISLTFLIKVFSDFCWLLDSAINSTTCLRHVVSKLKPFRLNSLMMSVLSSSIYIFNLVMVGRRTILGSLMLNWFCKGLYKLSIRLAPCFIIFCLFEDLVYLFCIWPFDWRFIYFDLVKLIWYNRMYFCS